MPHQDSPAEQHAAPSPGDQRPHASRRAVGRAYRLVRGLLALAMLVQVVFLAVVVFTPVTAKVHDWLDVTGPAQPADFIVCLGGNDRRLIWSAELHRQGLAPRVIVSNAPGAAERMKQILVDLGVPSPAVLVDVGPRTTGDHPGSIAHLPGVDPAVHRFLMVTDRPHSRRVAACFRRAGYRHFVVYSGHSASSAAECDPQRVWRERLLAVPTLAYELVALAKYWYAGQI